MAILHVNSLKESLVDLEKVVEVKRPEDLLNPQADIAYVLDGTVDFTGSGVSVEVPSGGLRIIGLGLDQFGITCSDADYTLFTTPVGGSGNLFIEGFSISISGSNSKVYDLTAATGDEAIEMQVINFNGCTSLGELTDYRQLLEIGTGRFGGTPELTFSGDWNGVRVSSSIVRGISNITSLFKEGTNLTYGGRFITDLNCDLPAVGALIDFSATNITNDEGLELKGVFVTRQGVIDASDTTIYPNIDHTNVKSLWSDNTGIPDTTKYIRSHVTTEIETSISTQNTYYPLEGTFTVGKSSHFSMPVNGQYELLSGNGTYHYSGNLVIDNGVNDIIKIRITKSTDGGATFPIEVFTIQRQVNSLPGNRDVAFIPISFIDDLVKGDRVRLEAANTTGTTNLTAEEDSSFSILRV